VNINSQVKRVLARRRAGVLLPVSALGGGHDALGEAAFSFIDWLVDAGFSVWQVLPLVPTDSGGSPYWARCDRAGNTALLDMQQADPGTEADFETFRARQASWLADFVLFEAISAQNGGAPWWQWPEGLKRREPDALRRAALVLAPQMDVLARAQWRFDAQWNEVRAYARDRDIAIFGDLPMYVAPDSVATWTEPSQFQLGSDGQPEFVAGVPPDYFAADGQFWGNPLYDWSRHQADGFAFWLRRLAHQLDRYDLLRIDHFRALSSYWSIPYAAKTAREGQWRQAKGRELLTAVRAHLPQLELVAEDLGVITPDVIALRRDFALPGMRVVQFGFDGDSANPHLPHQHECTSVIYTGTHDNDTTRSWYAGLSPTHKDLVRRYLGRADEEVLDALNRCVLASVGRLAVLPLQDILHLGSEGRLNRPGTTTGNWAWAVPTGVLGRELAAHYRGLNQLYDRI
jgi:4-alpha-glucanotransferase